jgi:hypothetical protein
MEDSLSVMVVREAQVEYRSLSRRALASLECKRDYSVTCRAAFSSAKARSAADRAAFSLDNAFFSSAAKAQIQKHHKVGKRIIGLKQ